MSDLLRMADQIGNNMTSAGLGLETIGSLLGADGCEHHLDDEDMNGLHHAVLALGAYVKAAGYDLCRATETEVRDAPESKGGEA